MLRDYLELDAFNFYIRGGTTPDSLRAFQHSGLLVPACGSTKTRITQVCFAGCSECQSW